VSHDRQAFQSPATDYAAQHRKYTSGCMHGSKDAAPIRKETVADD
jgi:hypothetical protein